MIGLLLANVVVPSLLSVAHLGIQWWTGKSKAKTAQQDAGSASNSPTALQDVSDVHDAPQQEQHAIESEASWVSNLIATLVACGAVALAFGLRNGFSLWPEDSWLRIPTATCLIGLCSMVTFRFPPIARNLLLAVAAVLAARMVFPTGESWDFLLPNFYYWIAAIASSVVIASLGASRRSIPEGGYLALGWIACLIAAAFLTAQSFLKVTEPLMAVASLFGCYGIATLFLRRDCGSSGVIPCGVFTASAAIANAQFNSYLGLSDLLSYCAMFLPAFVAAISLPFCQTPPSLRWTRISLLMTLATSLIGAIALAAVTYQLSGGGEEEW